MQVEKNTTNIWTLSGKNWGMPWKEASTPSSWYYKNIYLMDRILKDKPSVTRWVSTCVMGVILPLLCNLIPNSLDNLPIVRRRWEAFEVFHGKEKLNLSVMSVLRHLQVYMVLPNCGNLQIVSPILRFSSKALSVWLLLSTREMAGVISFDITNHW